MIRFHTALTGLILGCLLTLVARADTLDGVRQRGALACGVSTGLAGFGLPDNRGVWRGFDIDYCRAVAAAIFDDPQKIKFTPLSGKDRFTALQSGEVDILSRNTTWTQSREAGQGLLFAGINYFDGQGFLVRKSLGLDRRQNSPAPRSASSKAPPANSISPIISAPTVLKRKPWFSRPPTTRSRPMIPAAATFTPPMARRFTRKG